MTKTKMIAALTLAALATEASAQSRTFYDASGKVSGRSSASGNTVTNYDGRGRVISRETTTGNTTTVYDARGPQHRQGHNESPAMTTYPQKNFLR